MSFPPLLPPAITSSISITISRLLDISDRLATPIRPLATMSTTATPPTYPPYTEYVRALSLTHPELAPLAQLLTGRYPPLTECLTWTTSTNVDVVVADVHRNASQPVTFHQALDIQQLKLYATSDIPENVSMRLFLVEDVTAPVIELLGSVYGCHPSLFEEHMHSQASRQKYRTDLDGHLDGLARMDRPWGFNDCLGDRRHTPSGIGNLSFFSLPFYRKFHYPNEESRQRHESKRSMFREGHNKDALSKKALEERVSGAFVDNGPSRKHEVGIFLFDSIGESRSNASIPSMSSVNRPLFGSIPTFFTTHATRLPLAHLTVSRSSTRFALLSQLGDKRFIQQIGHDKAILLCAIINNVIGAWFEVMLDVEREVRPGGRDVMFAMHADNFLQQLADSFAEVGRNTDFLRKSLDLMRSGGCSTLRCTQGTEASLFRGGLTADLEDLVRRSEDFRGEIQQRIALVSAVQSIMESKKAVQQADAVGVLTAVATFFIPLSFVSSLFGMNVKEISAESTPIWVFCLISIIFTSISLFVSRYWKLLRSLWTYLFASQYSYNHPDLAILYETRRARWATLLKGDISWDTIMKTMK
ncbi:CorA-like Mg2+ transporter domain containing protein [Rhypophila sp. PSN 637]